MNPIRTLTLMFGPIGAIALCYAIAAPTKGFPSAHALRQLPPCPTNAALLDRCEFVAAQYRDLLPAEWTIRAHPPFVLAGDLSAEQLDEAYHSTLLPTSRALEIGYFDQPLSEPLAVLLLSGEDSFQRCTELLGHGERHEYAGIYSREQRRLILNHGTGAGTLAHELTHALAHVDFPEMPQWFDEGLASLHEECEFSTDGLRLIGLPNWRGKLLPQAMEANRLPTLVEFVTDPFGETGHAALDYALARYLCLYLQERQLLGAYYRKCRANAVNDPTGGWTLASVLGQKELNAVDEEFRTWIVSQRERSQRKTPARQSEINE